MEETIRPQEKRKTLSSFWVLNHGAQLYFGFDRRRCVDVKSPRAEQSDLDLFPQVSAPVSK